MTTRIAASRDDRLRCVVRRVIPLPYSAGAEPTLDRPAHVRAGSALVAVDHRLVVIQDDAGFVALVDPATASVEAVPLPMEDHVRLWDEGRGNKALKPDLEAAILVDGTLIALGSGSTPARERILVVEGVAGAEPAPRWVPAPGLYAALRGAPSFSGSEMNIEGAALIGDRVILFNRGNGAPRGGVAPTNATCEIRRESLLRLLMEGGATPTLDRITGYDLGLLAGAPLGFTDAAVQEGRLLFSAAAELSPDTYRDGEVLGSAIGWMAGGAAGWVEVSDERGLFTGKIEGIASHGGEPRRLWAVVDRDDPDTPAELCELELSGPWPG